MKLLSLTFVLFILGMGCQAQRTALPAETPVEFSVSYHQGGAMSRSYRMFEIEGGVLAYEEHKGHNRPKIIWSSNVERQEIAELYSAFRTNAFDLIENDERKAIVHDAGSESIAISFGVGDLFRVTYGHNSPLSGRNLERFRAVKKALDRLLDRHGPSPDTAVAEERLYGTWRVADERGGHAWFLQWKFEDGTFEQRGYPPLLQKGRYRVTKVEGGTVTVELFDQEGNFGSTNRTMQIELDTSTESITIAGRTEFKRIED